MGAHAVFFSNPLTERPVNFRSATPDRIVRW
jgi:hypothetical protein